MSGIEQILFLGGFSIIVNKNEHLCNGGCVVPVDFDTRRLFPDKITRTSRIQAASYCAKSFKSNHRFIFTFVLCEGVCGRIGKGGGNMRQPVAIYVIPGTRTKITSRVASV